MHEKVPNSENGVMSIGIKQNKNPRKILSSFRDVEFLLEKIQTKKFTKQIGEN